MSFYCNLALQFVQNFQEEFEDTKGVIRICKSKKDRQHNCQKKKDKWTNNYLQNTTQTKQQIEQHCSWEQLGVNAGAPEG